jgi:voltage-gated potassium channel
MADQQESRLDRWLERRVGRVGLRPRDAAYLIAGVWLVAVVVFGVLEHLVDSKTFPNVWLGMWWAIETVTTVGYGDVVPQQTAGKVIAGILMLGGLSFIAVVTAIVTSGFVSRAQARRRTTRADDPVLQRLDEMGRQLDALSAEVHRLGRGPGSGRTNDS